MIDIERQILENQEIMLSALSELMLYTMNPLQIHDRQIVNRLADNYNKTRMMLGKDYVKRWW